MRTFVLATACILIFATEPAVAQNCAAIQQACLDQCQGASGQIGSIPLVLGTGNTSVGRVKACVDRCFITPCGQTPLTTQLCDATAQTICNNSFRACNDACVPSTATTAAAITSQATCGTSCCTQLQHCLRARLCDLSTILVLNCSENPGAAPVAGAAPATGAGTPAP
jgi:hypothetical protein